MPDAEETLKNRRLRTNEGVKVRTKNRKPKKSPVKDGSHQGSPEILSRSL